MEYNLENILTATMLKQILDLVYMERYARTKAGHMEYRLPHRFLPSLKGRHSCKPISIRIRPNGKR